MRYNAIYSRSERVFAAGADLRAITDADAPQMRRSGLQALVCPGPVPQAPDHSGARARARAGCELAVHGDLIVTADNALFGQPEIKVGATDPAGRAHARLAVLLTGEPINGRTACDWGLASDACAAEEVLKRAIEIAATIAPAPQSCAEQIKELVRLGADLPLEAASALDRQAFWLTFGAAHQREGMAAFLEKRPPIFNCGALLEKGAARD
jgi:enoyl-CoA hydratase/carnithine racemase